MAGLTFKSSDGITWTAATTAAQFGKHSGQTSAVLNNNMWVIGGLNDNLDPTNEVWSSTDGLNWTQVTTNTTFTARCSHAGMFFNNKLWVIAGQTGPGTDTNDVWSSQ